MIKVFIYLVIVLVCPVLNAATETELTNNTIAKSRGLSAGFIDAARSQDSANKPWDKGRGYGILAELDTTPSANTGTDNGTGSGIDSTGHVNTGTDNGTGTGLDTTNSANTGTGNGTGSGMDTTTHQNTGTHY